jgi:hypothetical protein
MPLIRVIDQNRMVKIEFTGPKIVVKNVENDGDNSQNKGYCVHLKHFQIDLVGY